MGSIKGIKNRMKNRRGSRKFFETEKTSFENAETEIENDSADIAGEAGLVGAIDGDDERVAGLVRMLDLNDVVIGARDSHHRSHKALYSWQVKGNDGWLRLKLRFG